MTSNRIKGRIATQTQRIDAKLAANVVSRALQIRLTLASAVGKCILRLSGGAKQVQHPSSTCDLCKGSVDIIIASALPVIILAMVISRRGFDCTCVKVVSVVAGCARCLQICAARASHLIVQMLARHLVEVFAVWDVAVLLGRSLAWFFIAGQARSSTLVVGCHDRGTLNLRPSELCTAIHSLIGMAGPSKASNICAGLAVNVAPLCGASRQRSQL